MKKVDPITGKVRKREDGKMLKPEGWQPPNVKAVLERCLDGYKRVFRRAVIVSQAF